MVHGIPFIYNKIPSEMYDVSLVFINGNSTNRESGSKVEFVTDSINRNPRLLFLNAKQSVPLSFDIEVVFSKPVDIFILTEVKDWLGGELNFRELQICSDNFAGYYFNCYIELKEDLVYAGGYAGIRATVHCDSPWAWQFEDKEEYIFDNSQKAHRIQFNNLSADSEMLKPIIEVTVRNNGDASIINISNGNKETKFTGLKAGETVKLDNLWGFIESSTGIHRVANFNKVFLKLVKGLNELSISENISKLIIRYQNAKRIGGDYY